MKPRRARPAVPVHGHSIVDPSRSAAASPATRLRLRAQGFSLPTKGVTVVVRFEPDETAEPGQEQPHFPAGFRIAGARRAQLLAGRCANRRSTQLCSGSPSQVPMLVSPRPPNPGIPCPGLQAGRSSPGEWRTAATAGGRSPQIPLALVSSLLRLYSQATTLASLSTVTHFTVTHLALTSAISDTTLIWQ